MIDLCLRRVVRYGMELYIITLDGRELHSYMSREQAVTVYTRLQYKLAGH